MATTTGHISPQTRISAALKTTSTTLLTPGDSIHYRQPINMALIVTKDKSKESTNILKPKHKLQNSRFETMEANHETAISHHEIMINLNCLMTVLGYCSKSPAGVTLAITLSYCRLGKGFRLATISPHAISSSHGGWFDCCLWAGAYSSTAPDGPLFIPVGLVDVFPHVETH